jgi:TP901 family phage tail tape measure protein
MADSVINLIIRGKDDVSSVLSGVKGGIGGLGGAFGSMQTVGVAAMSAIAVGALAAGAAVIGIGGSAVSAAMDMETQMSTIAAGMNTTVEGIAPLGDLIQDLGLDPNLKVTAVEAAQSIDMLSRNGLTMTEILDGAAHSTVLLANATGATFDGAATIATDAMAIFNIEAKDMGEAVNGITAVTMASKFGIEDYAMALSQGGGVAATAGVEFNDFNAAITAISPLFASGSDAGTSFKTMLTSIASPSTAAAELMDRLGLEFYDAQGNMKSMGEISGELNRALYGTSTAIEIVSGLTKEQTDELGRLIGMHDKGKQSISDYENGIVGLGLTEEERAKKIQDLRVQQTNLEAAMKPLQEITDTTTSVTRKLSEEERTAALATIFGTDAMRAASAMATMNEESFSALMGTMGETDALKNAATRMDNLAGVIDILKGIGESLMISFGTGLLPIFRLFADAGLAFATSVLPKIESGMAIISNSVSVFTKLLSDGMDPLSAFIVTISDMAPKGLLLSLIGFRDALPGIIEKISVFKDQVLAFIEPITSWIGQNVQLSDVLTGVGVAIASVVIPAIISIVSALAPVILAFGAVVGIVALMRQAWENDWNGIREKTATAITTIKTTITNVFNGIKTFWAEHGDAIMAGAKEVWDFVSGVVKFQVEATVYIVKKIFTGLQAFWAEHGDTIMAVASAVWNGIKTTVETVGAIIKQVWSAFQSAMEGDWSAFGEHLQAAWGIAWEGIKKLLAAAWEGIKSAFGAAIQWVKDLITETDWLQLGKDIALGIAKGIIWGVGQVGDAVMSVAGAAFDAAQGFLGIHSPSTLAAEQIGAPFAQGIGVGITGEMGAVGGQVTRSLQGNLMQSPSLAAPASRQQTTQISNTYHVTINDTRAMAVFLDYLQSIEGRAALEAI